MDQDTDKDPVFHEQKYNKVRVIYRNLRELDLKMSRKTWHKGFYTRYQEIEVCCRDVDFFSKYLTSLLVKSSDIAKHKKKKALEGIVNKFEKKKEDYRKVIDMIKQSYGEEEDYEVAVCYNRLGNSLRTQEREKPREALVCLELAAKIIRSQGVESDPELITSYYEMSAAYNDLHQYTKSREYFQKALSAIQARAIECLNVLAWIEYHKKNYDNFFDVLELLLEMRIFFDAENKSRIAQTYKDIGYVYFKLENYGLALHEFQKALEIEQISYQNSYLNCRDSWVIEKLSHQEKYDKAYKMYEDLFNLASSNKGDIQAFCAFYPKVQSGMRDISIKKLRLFFSLDKDIFQKLIREKDGQKTAFYKELGNSLIPEGKPQDAIVFLESAAKIIDSKGFARNPKLIISYLQKSLTESFSKFALSESRTNNSLDFYKLVLQTHISFLGENKPELTKTYINIGKDYISLREYDKALENFQKAVCIIIDTLGENHIEISCCLDRIGDIYQFYQVNYSELQKIMKRKLKIELGYFGPKHEAVAKTYSRLGTAYAGGKKHQKALFNHLVSFKINQSLNQETWPEKAVRYLTNIGDTFFEAKSLSQTENVIKKAQKASEKAFGKNNDRMRVTTLFLERTQRAKSFYDINCNGSLF